MCHSILKEYVTDVSFTFTVANGIWNNMLEPIGAKTTNWQDLFEKFLCPTPERPYFATLKNSRKNLQRN